MLLKRYLSILVLSSVLFRMTAQNTNNVGINDDNSNPDASAMLHVQSTNKGVLVPRMTSGQRIAISNPAVGLLVFDSTTESFWFRNDTSWIQLSASNGLAGNDLSGNYPNPTVAGIQGQPVEAMQPQQGQALIYDNGAWKPMDIPVYVPDIAIFEEQYPHGQFPATAFYDPMIDTFQIRLLNTVVDSGSGNVTLDATKGYLRFQPGTYYIQASAPAWQTNRHKLLLTRTDNNAIALTGTNEYSRYNVNPSTSSTTQSRSSINGILTVPAGPAIEYKLDHFFQTVDSSEVDELHLGVEFSDPNSNIDWSGIRQVFSTVIVQKIR